MVDTVWLARRLLEGRLKRVGLASLAYFFGTSAQPCHRALADSEATAEISLGADRPRPGAGCRDGRAARRPLRPARTAARRQALARGRGALPPGRLPLPGDRNEQVLYVGRARDLARLRRTSAPTGSDPRSRRRSALERVEWRVLGSELEPGQEPRLLRAAAAGERPQRPPDRYVSPPPRCRLVRHRHARAARASEEPTPRAGGGARARRLGRRTGRGPAAAAGTAAPAVRRPAFRGRPAARPDRRARGSSERWPNSTAPGRAALLFRLEDGRRVFVGGRIAARGRSSTATRANGGGGRPRRGRPGGASRRALPTPTSCC